MAVFTPLTESDIQTHLKNYDLGELHAWHGIAEGVENSNFYLETTTGRYILTLFEKRTSEADLPYFIGLMEHLATHGIYCPKPLPSRQDQLTSRLKDRPAVIVTFINGQGVRAIETHHLVSLGMLAAQMHMAGKDFTPTRANTLSLAGWQALAEKMGTRADEIAPGLARLIADEIDYLNAHWPRHLPNGPVHADLFPDNVFFDGAELSGVIDFYFACNEVFAYDLAICAAAWCFDTQHQFIPERLYALLRGYESVCPLIEDERSAFPILLRGAALRFLLTRAHDQLFHPAGAQVTQKDPLEYLAKLRYFQDA